MESLTFRWGSKGFLHNSTQLFNISHMHMQEFTWNDQDSKIIEKDSPNFA